MNSNKKQTLIEEQKRLLESYGNLDGRQSDIETEKVEIGWRGKKPEDGQRYYYVSCRLKGIFIDSICWDNDGDDLKAYELCNVFLGVEMARKFMFLTEPQRALAFALKHLHGPGWDTWIDWKDDLKKKFCLWFYADNFLKIESTEIGKQVHDLLHAKSEEVMNQAVELIGEKTAREACGDFNVPSNA